MLSGQTTRRRATAQALAGLGAGALVLWVVTAVIIAIAGLSSRVDIGAGSALFLALALASPALLFLTVGAVTSQVAPTRRRAAGFGAVVLGVSYCLRMLGDAGIGLPWLTWLSPLGWVERLAPLTSNDPVPLLPIFAAAAVLAVVAVALSGARDVGSGMLPDRSHSAPRLALLRGQLGLCIRLTRGVDLAWILALAVTGLIFGLVAQGAGTTLAGSSVQQVLAKLGATGGGTGAYLGVVFLIVAALIGFAAAGQIGSRRETRRHKGGSTTCWCDPSHARGGWRGVWPWLSPSSSPAGSSPASSRCSVRPHNTPPSTAGSLLAAGVNAAVPAVFVLGVGALLFGLWPRAAAAGVYAVLAWSLLIELVGGIGAASHWLLDTSVFHHVASAPAVPVDWAADGWLTAAAAIAALVGAAAFARRDLQGA